MSQDINVLALVKGGERYVFLYDETGLHWQEHYNNWEPQNAAVGRFRKDSDDQFVWCRSRYAEHQKPFVFDSSGNVVFEYEMDRVAPPGWTASGVEVIGGPESHENGKFAWIMDPDGNKVELWEPMIWDDKNKEA